MKLPSAKTVLWRLLRMVVAMYIVLFLIQRWLVFPAYMADIVNGKLQAPAAYGLTDYTEVPLTTSDGVHILGWSHITDKNAPIILYLHGNAMHIAAHIPRYKALTEAGYGIFALSYRGYGRSEGSPSEEGLYRDARAAIAWLKTNYLNTPLIVYGESLGTGVATKMAKEYKLNGLVLQSAYTSIADVAAETYWFLPGTHALVWDKFDSLSRMKDIHCPVLILHGDKDNQIPIAHGEALAAQANEPKYFVTVQGAGHVNIPDAVIVKEMKAFFSYGN